MNGVVDHNVDGLGDVVGRLRGEAAVGPAPIAQPNQIPRQAIVIDHQVGAKNNQ